jgi:hypothetical protein
MVLAAPPFSASVAYYSPAFSTIASDIVALALLKLEEHSATMSTPPERGFPKPSAITTDSGPSGSSGLAGVERGTVEPIGLLGDMVENGRVEQATSACLFTRNTFVGARELRIIILS